MARPRTVSDDDILSCTRDTCIEHGARVSIDQIAEKLGISAPAILKRFGNKDALLVKALQPPIDPPWAAHIERGPDDRPLAKQLEDMFDEISEFFAEIIPCIAVLRESGIDIHKMAHMQKAPVRGLEAIASWLKQATKKGIAAVDNTDIAATAIMGSIQFHSFLSHMVRHSWSEQAQHKYNRSLAKLYARAFAPAGTQEKRR